MLGALVSALRKGTSLQFSLWCYCNELQKLFRVTLAAHHYLQRLVVVLTRFRLKSTWARELLLDFLHLTALLDSSLQLLRSTQGKSSFSPSYISRPSLISRPPSTSAPSLTTKWLPCPLILSSSSSSALWMSGIYNISPASARELRISRSHARSLVAVNFPLARPSATAQTGLAAYQIYQATQGRSQGFPGEEWKNREM